MRLCPYGCGTSIEGMRQGARYVSDAHRKRATRKPRETRTEATPPPQGNPDTPLTAPRLLPR